MAYDEHLSAWPECHNIHHAIFNAQVVYSPHDQGWTMSCWLGDEALKTWSENTWRYGPFDGPKDIAADLATYLRTVLHKRVLDGVLDYPQR